MKFAYADPPYHGLAYYYAGGVEVNFPLLIAHLVNDYPDGWAMSCHTPSLGYLLNLCPPGVRIGAWVKPFCSFKPNVNPAYAWEPVLFMGGRKKSRQERTVRDWCSVNITLRKGLVGVKPEVFCRWIFSLLGMQPGDLLDDLFPGTGVVADTFEKWRLEMNGAASGKQ